MGGTGDEYGYNAGVNSDKTRIFIKNIYLVVFTSLIWSIFKECRFKQFTYFCSPHGDHFDLESVISYR